VLPVVPEVGEQPVGEGAGEAPIAQMMREGDGSFAADDFEGWRHISASTREWMDDITIDDFNPDLEIKRLTETRDYVKRVLREHPDLVRALDDEGAKMVRNLDRLDDCSTKVIFTTDPSDYGMGSSHTRPPAAFKVFYGPYSADRSRIPEWMRNKLGLDPIYTSIHEIHHACGSATELDLFSDVLAIGRHYELGNNLNPRAVEDQMFSIFNTAMQRAAGKRKGRVLRNRTALKWLWKQYPDDVESFVSQWKNAEKLLGKIKRW